MNTQVFLLELLVAGFFAVACVRSRASQTGQTMRLRDFFFLTDRIERLRRSRWQWFSMVLLLFVIRKQLGVPMVLEVTVLVQLVVFLSLPVAKPAEAVRR